MKTLLIVAMLMLCAGCASERASKGEPLQGQTDDDMRKDIAACVPPSSFGDVMLTGGLIASMNRESEYKGCMRGKGYVAIPKMPKDAGPKSGG